MTISRASRLAGACRSAALVFLLTVSGLPAIAAPDPVIAPDGEVMLEVRQGRLIRLPRAASAVFVADPEVADVQAHSPTLIYLFGRKGGTTTLYAVDNGENVLLQREVRVEHHLSGLRRALDEIAPGSGVDVRSIDGGIILDGAVENPQRAQEVRELVGRFLGENETLVNRLDVAASTQVSLRVRVVEVSRAVTKQFGINLDALLSPGDFFFGLATGRPFLSADRTLFQRFADETGTAAALAGSYNGDGVDVNGVVDALERNGFVNVLAEPNLTALSGETASFLAGGEFPVPVGRDEDTIEIQFKQFGVSLAFTPTVLSRERISLRVRPEVSELSDNGAIQLDNLTIPALSTRRAETTVELGSGQSFAIGGLISNTTRDNLEKVPGLGDVPVLGPLFRSTSFRRSETELVILVTPYLVRPVTSASKLATPADDLAAVGDLERIIQGRIARAATRSAAMPSSSRLAGPAGFTLQ